MDKANLLFVMSIFGRLFKWVPSPLKALREHLHIQQEWQEFKHHMKPHQLKIYLGLVLLAYPLYAPYARQAKQWAQYHVTSNINAFLGVDRPAFQITDNFAKNLLGSIFGDENIKHEGLEFVKSIIQEEKFVDDILKLLVSVLKSQDFLQPLQGSAKTLVVSLLDDSEVQTAVQRSLVNVVESAQVKASLIQLIESAFSSKESVETIVGLLKKGITDQEVKEALGETVNYSAQQLLKDEETLNQLKIFIFFLLRKFENDEEIKSMMDILFAKGLGLTKKKKDNDLERMLRDMDQKKSRKDPQL